jgi:hypothetical protein
MSIVVFFEWQAIGCQTIIVEVAEIVFSFITIAYQQATLFQQGYLFFK